MTLKEQLDAIREKSRERIPPAARAIMERAVDDLRRDGAVDRVVAVGERAPRFTLPGTAGRTVDLDERLRHGPVVLSFFRGRW